jgi:hypothetical protein
MGSITSKKITLSFTEESPFPKYAAKKMYMPGSADVCIAGDCDADAYHTVLCTENIDALFSQE